MKKTFILVLLVSLTVIFLGTTAFYYSQELQVVTDRNENKNTITEDVVSHSTPVFDEPIFENNEDLQADNIIINDDIIEIFEEQDQEIITEQTVEEEVEIIEGEQIGEIEEITDDEYIEVKGEIELKDVVENNIVQINSTLNNEGSTFPIDLYSDSSIHKFVGSQVPFSDVTYIPEDLIPFTSSYIIDAKGDGHMRKEALEAFERLSNGFYADFGEEIVVISTYRSYLYQKGIKDRGCPDNLCAKAGYSEHQGGLAVDLWEATTNSEFLGKEGLKLYYYWLTENAHLYGFHNSYQKGIDIDGYDREPWHWRYVGKELATYLMQNDLTHTEFYNQQQSDEA